MSILAKALNVPTKSSESDTQYEKNEKNELSPVHDVPRACLGPTVCSVIGICGRISCLVGDDRSLFAREIRSARDPRNLHRVPHRYFEEGE
jgi:hypothetical protein